MSTVKAKRTKKRLESNLNEIPENKQAIAINLIDDMVFLIDVMEQLKKEIKKNGVVDNFKQGKQQFVRESPALKSYNQSLQRCTSLYKQYEALLPEEIQEDEENPVLDFVARAL